MNELEKIADQLSRAIDGNAWHGPSLFELLNNVSAEQAYSHSISNVHSIWEIVKHLTTWHNAVLRRIEGDASGITAEEDWLPVNDSSDSEWKNSIEALKGSFKSLKYAILNFPLHEIDEKVLNTEQTFYILFHGVIQHDIYHAGQIAFLKKQVQ